MVILQDELQNIDPGFDQRQEPQEPAQDIPETLLKPDGFQIPCNLHATLEDIMNPEQFEEPHKQYIRKIFMEKYPSLIATHAYDIGQISKTMGYYTIELKENTTLPVFRKMYYLSPGETQQMRDICNFLIRYKIIERASHQGDFRHLHASPGYLVARANPMASARLIIDYRLLNQCIKTASPAIPCIQTTLQELRGMAMFTTTDLTSAYYSVEIAPECRHLTRFIVNEGSFLLRTLPMGLSLSPYVFGEIGYRMVHMRPKLNPAGQPIYLKENVVDLENDRLPGVHIFYDDLLIATPPYATYEQTVREHYKVVDQIMGRLHFHSAKISFEKSLLGRTSIKFLGWYIQYNQLLPDPKRINKLLATQFPENQKALKSFLGLLQTISTCCPQNFMREVAVLNPLSSTTTPYTPERHHKVAFEQLKKLLTTTPLYSNIVDPRAKKVLFVDSSDRGNYAAVLGQIQEINPGQIHIPEHLILDDPVDRIIFDKQLCYQSVPLYFHSTYIPRSEMEPPYQILPVKDPAYLQTDFLGYKEDNVENSLFVALRSIQYAYGCQLLDEKTIRQEVFEKLKTSIIRFHLLSTVFENNKINYDLFIKQFTQAQGPPDDDFKLIDLISQILHRPITVISSLKQHKGQEIFHFTASSTKPPFVLGVYMKKNKIIFRPYFVDKNNSFDLKELQQKFQIVAFWTKAISKADANRPIMEKELFAILSALNALSSLIGKSEILCLTDSKPLFLLYSNPVTRSSSKLCRWGTKLSAEWPNLSLRFVRTNHNLADFLTRDLNISPIDIKRLPLQNYGVQDLMANIDETKNYSIKEWIEFVHENQHLLKYTEPKQIKADVLALNNTAKNIAKLLDPIKTLNIKVSHSQIAAEQKKEFKHIIEMLIQQPELEREIENQKYKLISGTLYMLQDDMFLIKLPQKLEGALLAFTHLSLNHAGFARMEAALYPYCFPNKTGKIRHLAQRCYACTLQNATTRKHVLGSFPIPEYIFQTVCLDLLENLPPNQHYSHILLMVCPLTSFLLTYPLKKKTSDMVTFHFLFNIFQIFNIKYFLADNGPAFSHTNILTILHTLNIKRIQIASSHPISNGKTEAFVKKVKYILKKTLAVFPEYQWLDILPIITKLMNSTPNVDTNLSPLQLLHGPTSISAESQMIQNPLPKVYPTLINQKSTVEKKQIETEKIVKFIREELKLEKIEKLAKLNKHKFHTQLKIGDYCFARDRTIIAGSTRPLKTVFSDDPWLVLQIRPTTAVVRRLADQFTTVYGFSDLKKYSRLDPTFSTLPQNVKDILINNFQNLDLLQLTTIQEHAELNIPTGPSLTDEESDQNFEISLPTIMEEDEQGKPTNKQTAPVSDTDKNPEKTLEMELQDTAITSLQSNNPKVQDSNAPSVETLHNTVHSKPNKPTTPLLRTSPIMTRQQTNKLRLSNSSDSDSDSDPDLERRKVSFQ